MFGRKIPMNVFKSEKIFNLLQMNIDEHSTKFRHNFEFLELVAEKKKKKKSATEILSHTLDIRVHRGITSNFNIKISWYEIEPQSIRNLIFFESKLLIFT